MTEPQHDVSIHYSGIAGRIDIEDSRAVCSCGWTTGWDNGYRFVTRLRARWHRRRNWVIDKALGDEDG